MTKGKFVVIAARKGVGKMKMNNVVVVGLGLVVAAIGQGFAAPTIDGVINTGEGWTLFRENPDARPYLGGSTTGSDDTLETSQYHWWDGIAMYWAVDP
ncbi:MAG: hypothetical protein N3A53_01590, partial [Verrucomicrobiae bacterium]|nr:hypothetical protein [Verrucomicrobiae bacterium]